MQPPPDPTPSPSEAPDKESSPPSTRSGRLFLVAGAMGLLAAGTFIAGLLLRGWLGSRWPALSVMAALLLVFKIAVDRFARRAAPAQGVVVTSLGAASLAPLFAMGALWAMSDPLVASSWRCGTGDMSLLMLAPFGFFLTAALGTTVAAAVLGRSRSAPFRALLRATAVVAAAAAAALVVLSAARAARQPDIDHYIESLPLMTTLAPLSGAHVSSQPRPSGFREQVNVSSRVAGNVALYRHCWSDSCGVAAGDAATVQATLPLNELRSFGGSADAPVTVREDAAHHFVVLSGPGGLAFGEPNHFASAENTEHEPRLWPAIDVGVRDVADAASPPLGWLIGGAAGMLAAGAVWLAGARRSRRLRAFLAGAPGTVGENGWIHFEDGRAAARVDPGAGIAAGPVLVLHDATSARGAYRDSGLLGAAQVLAGTRQEWAERRAVATAQVHAQVIAIALLSTAPLFAAMTAGLVV